MESVSQGSLGSRGDRMVSAKAAVCSVDTPFQIRMIMRSNANPASCTLYDDHVIFSAGTHICRQNDVRRP